MALHKPELGESQKILGNKMFLGTSRKHVGNCARETNKSPRISYDLCQGFLGNTGKLWFSG